MSKKIGVNDMFSRLMKRFHKWNDQTLIDPMKIVLPLALGLFTVFALANLTSAKADSCNSGAWKAHLVKLEQTYSGWSISHYRVRSLVRELSSRTVVTDADFGRVLRLRDVGEDVDFLGTLIFHILQEHKGQICDPATCLPQQT